MFDNVILDYPKETPANHVSNICHVFDLKRCAQDLCRLNMVDIIDNILDMIVLSINQSEGICIKSHE